MKIVNDLTTIDQLKALRVEETTVHKNPALKCTSPDAPGVEFYLVADPGEGVWQQRMIFIVRTEQNDGNFDEYDKHGQDVYGSDIVAITRDREVMIARELRDADFAPITDDSVRVFPFEVAEPDKNIGKINLSDEIHESGWNPGWVVTDGDKLFEADAVVLGLVMKNDLGRDFLVSNLPGVPKLDR